MVTILLILFSYLLEVTLKYYFPKTGIFNYIEPMFLVSFLIVYIMLNYKNKNSLYIVITSALIYDFFFGNILFLYTLIFLILYYFIKFISKQLEAYFMIKCLVFVLSFISFFILKYLILLWIGYNYTITFLLNQIIQSAIINILFGLTIYYLLGIKYKKF